MKTLTPEHEPLDYKYAIMGYEEMGLGTIITFTLQRQDLIQSVNYGPINC